MERLQLEFPKLSRKALEDADAFASRQEFRRKRVKALYRDFLREKSELERKAEEQIIHLVNVRIENNKKTFSKLQQH